MTVRRRRARDVLVRDGETAVLVTGRVVRLGELSSMIYALCAEPIEVEQLARALETSFGAPEGISVVQATKDAVADLVRHGVLVER